MFQPRKWPDLTLKSPGIKPRRHNNSTGSNSGMSLPAGTLPFSQKSLHLNSSEGEQSPPPANQTSANDFTVFANVNLQGGGGGGGGGSGGGSSTNSSHSHHNFSQSQINLSSISTSVSDLSDTFSLHSSVGTAAPELPKRSNSIVSYTLSERQNPILSPRLSDSLINLRYPTPSVISPKILDSLNEEQNHENENNSSSSCHPAISPRNNLNRTNHLINENCDFYGGGGGGGGSMTLPRNSNFRSSTYSTASTIIDSMENSFHDHPPNVFPPSPKLQNTGGGGGGGVIGVGTLNNLDQMHELDVPISPHVNVPNNHHNFNHIPPPLPPRVKRRDSTYDTTAQTAQTRQAPDAPQVLLFYIFFYVFFF